MWVVLTGSTSSADITLPLEGYCKPGCYFPIRIDGTDATHALLFTADNCLPSDMDTPVSGRAIVPMLATGQPRELHWSGGSLPLHALADNERLIAATSDDISAAQVLFPGKGLIPIRLDPADLLPGPPIVWETLDAIQLDSAQFARLNDAHRSALLAGGVMLISTGTSPPDNRWPWKKVGSVWVLATNIAGPIGEVINENIYAPTFAWTPGWSASVRGQVMAVAILLVLAIAGLMLRPSRITFIAALGLSILTTIGIIVWRRSLPSVDLAGGDILIAGNGLVQRDALVYERAKKPSTQIIPWIGWTHPLFASASGLSQSEMRLNVSANEDLSLIYQATPGHTMAFLRREVEPGDLPATTSAPDSPMQEAASGEYLSADRKITGELRGTQNRWPTIVIEENPSGLPIQRQATSR